LEETLTCFACPAAVNPLALVLPLGPELEPDPEVFTVDGRGTELMAEFINASGQNAKGARQTQSHAGRVGLGYVEVEAEKFPLGSANQLRESQGGRSKRGGV